MIPLPSWAAVAAIVLGVLSAASGWKVSEWRCKAGLAESVQRAQEQARKIALEDAEVSAGFELSREKIRTVYRDRVVEVIKHVPTGPACTLDADGLRLLNAALRNDPPADPAKPDYTMPAPPAGAGWFVR